MNMRLSPCPLSGTVAAPVSKSEAHRLLICAALSDGPTRLLADTGFMSQDIEATADCLCALGAKISVKNGALEVTPLDRDSMPEHPVLNCQESGSTLRFLLPVAAALTEHAVFTGTGRLPERPVGELLTALETGGVSVTSNTLPFETRGRLRPGGYELPGNVSSQYVSGLLLALPLLDGESEIRLTSELKSAAYVDITLSAMASFGIAPERRGRVFHINKNKNKLKNKNPFRSPGTMAVGGDWSGAAFFLTAGAMKNLHPEASGPVTVKGLDPGSCQGDRAVLDLLKIFGADVTLNRADGSATVTHCSENLNLQRRVDIDPTPDLLPALAILAACTDGETEFFNGGRLRLKESDRLTATAAMIHALGGQVCELPDGLIVTGGRPLTGGVVDGFHDHRIVMSAAIAAGACSGDVLITDSEAVSKSYPAFFDDYRRLGGEYHVV